MDQIYTGLKYRLLALLGFKGPFRSSGEVLAAADRLICALEDGGFEAAAASVRRGFVSLNGLTDGWALFLEGLEKAERALPPLAPPGLRRSLADLRSAARFALFGR